MKVWHSFNTRTVTPTTSGAAAGLTALSDNGRILECSIEAAAGNTGSVFIRKAGTSTFDELAAEAVRVLYVNDLAEIEAYSSNGTEVLNIHVHTNF